MTLTNEQYERIALWMDGETVQLTAEERQAAEEVRAGEAWLGGAMSGEAVPDRAMAQAKRAVRASLGRRLAVRGRFVAVAAAGTAVAAAIVIAWTVRIQAPAAPAPRPKAPADYAWVRAMQEPPGGQAIQTLAGELDRLEAELAVSRQPSPTERQIDALQHEINNFWREDVPSGEGGI